MDWKPVKDIRPLNGIRFKKPYLLKIEIKYYSKTMNTYFIGELIRLEFFPDGKPTKAIWKIENENEISKSLPITHYCELD